MLNHGTYNLPDNEFKTQRISLNLKSVKIWPRKNKALYSRSFAIYMSYVFVTVNPRSGLLQSSLITLYTMYITWSAMTNSPGRNTLTCNQ